MDPGLLESEALEPSKDGLNTQSKGVYIYRPANAKPAKSQNERPSKRRKVDSSKPVKQEKQEKHVQGPQICPFAPLLNGEESASSVEMRYNTYQQLWSKQEAKIQEVLEDVDSKVLDNVLSFVKESSSQIYDGCIPSALVTVGSNVSSLGRLLTRLNERLTTTEEGGVIVLESGDAPNLKTTLKNIIRGAVTNTEGNDGYQSFLTDRDGPRLLGYDLDLLSDYVERKGTTKLVLAFRDSEAFDPNLLTDLLSLLSSWLDRIPFTLLFGISTSVELFEGRLPRSSVSLLRGKYFELHEASNCVDRIYQRIQDEEDSEFWLGHNITGVLFERSSDYFHTPEAFSRTVKYAYMCHCFANPLAVLLSADSASAELPHGKLCEAIRNIPSFRKFCEELLDGGYAKQVRNLLENDQYLFQESLKYLEQGQQKMRNMFEAIEVIRVFLNHLDISKKTSTSELAIHALSGELLNSQIVDDILTTTKTLDSEGLKDLLGMIPESLVDNSDLRQIQSDFESLLQTYPNAGPLRSEYDNRNSTMKTTVVRQQVQLTKNKTKQPKENIEYTNIVNRLHVMFEAYLTETLIKPQDLFLHEAFLLDMRNPLKDTFAPRPRFAIERALASPFDYLLSTSDAPEAKAKQPATAILYQLYLESGAIVNIHDLWSAFYAVFESDQGEKCDERMVMALFYRALSELKALGVVKNSRKKVDHIAKTSWTGL